MPAAAVAPGQICLCFVDPVLATKLEVKKQKSQHVVARASTQKHEHTYLVRLVGEQHRVDEVVDDAVQPGAQAAAGDDRPSHLRRDEVECRSRPFSSLLTAAPMVTTNRFDTRAQNAAGAVAHKRPFLHFVPKGLVFCDVEQTRRVLHPTG